MLEPRFKRPKRIVPRSSRDHGGIIIAKWTFFFFNVFLPHLSGKPPPIPLPFNPSAAQYHAFAFPIPDLRGRGVGGGLPLITYYNKVTHWKETIRPVSIKQYPEIGEPYSYQELVDRALEYHCDLTMAGRYTKTQPYKSSELRLRGALGYSSLLQECFQVVCFYTVKAGINLHNMKYVFLPEGNVPQNLFRDRIKFLMEYFLCGTMTKYN